MKNLSVRSKLLLSFAAILLLFGVSIFVGLTAMKGINKDVKTFHSESYMMQKSANALEMNYERLLMMIYRAISTLDTDITKDALDTIPVCQTNISEQMGLLEKHYCEDGDISLLTGLKQYLSDLQPKLDYIIGLVKTNSQESNAIASAYMETDCVPMIRESLDLLTAIITDADVDAENLIDEINHDQNMTMLLLLGLCIGGIVIGLVLCIYVTRLIVRPLVQIKKVMADVRKGKLDTKLQYASKDELGQVAEDIKQTLRAFIRIIADISNCLDMLGKGDFNADCKETELYVGDYQAILQSIGQITDKLSDTVYQINVSAEQVMDGSAQVAEGSQRLAQGSAEQAGTVEELSHTVNKINEQIQKNAVNADDASRFVLSVGEEVTKSNAHMKDMMLAMKDISDSSNEISKIIKTIEDIAFQTNILALNAAVEAARAGTAGKGFAVVAQEVRSLASKSAAASDTTSALIERSIHAVENGTRIAEETAAALGNVVEGAGKVEAAIAGIAEASGAQASSAKQVAQGIDDISAIVQTNSATSQESAASSEELSGQAQLLKSLVSSFHLKKTAERQQRPQETVRAASPSSRQIYLNDGSKY